MATTEIQLLAFCEAFLDALMQTKQGKLWHNAGEIHG